MEAWDVWEVGECRRVGFGTADKGLGPSADRTLPLAPTGDSALSGDRIRAHFHPKLPPQSPTTNSRHDLTRHQVDVSSFTDLEAKNGKKYTVYNVETLNRYGGLSPTSKHPPTHQLTH